MHVCTSAICAGMMEAWGMDVVKDGGGCVPMQISVLHQSTEAILEDQDGVINFDWVWVTTFKPKLQSLYKMKSVTDTRKSALFSEIDSFYTNKP